VPTLSAIIITKNEAGNIAACLDSVAFCDQRIVVDCGSTTTRLRLRARRVPRLPFALGTDSGPRKSCAVARYRDWVLSLDADERVTPALAQAIRTAMVQGGCVGYEMRGSHAFSGAR